MKQLKFPTKSAYGSRILAVVGVAILLTFAPATAFSADEREGRDTQAPHYSVEIEPHVSFGPASVYGGSGFGGGVRFGIPLVAGHIGSVPDNLAIGFGADLIHYDSCYYGVNCGANYLFLPVVAQWNLFFARRFSFFVEGGAFVYKGWRDECSFGAGLGCRAPSDLGALPSLAVGGRVYFSDSVAFTFRLGYPTVTLGISIL